MDTNQGSSTAGHPIAPIAHDRIMGPLARIAATNALLTILTLSIWRFWGRVRVRRAIWSATSLFGDRLEYTGTGGELFRGFLIALLFFAPLMVVLWTIELLFANRPIVANIVTGAVIVVFAALGLFAVQAARRYVASRTTWRGIRFALDGTPAGYMRSQIGWWLLLVVTLGLAYPWLTAADTRWTIGRLRIGDQAFAFDGKGSQLFLPFIVSIVQNVILCIVLVALVLAAVSYGAGSTQAAWYVAVQVLPLLVILVLLFGPGWVSFQAAFLRWRAEHAMLGGVSFAMDGATPWRVFRLIYGNLLLTIFTLGVLSPLAMARTAAFTALHLRCSGIPDLSATLQTGAGPHTGEGLASLLSADAFAA
ncbi:MAG: DUF898 domain-containing protein [Acetobacteraceae bacterium]|nr:DUF898 domain-containing protein [Acetobacteraceae bacterium]